VSAPAAHDIEQLADALARLLAAHWRRHHSDGQTEAEASQSGATEDGPLAPLESPASSLPEEAKTVLHATPERRRR
jgi:hypothetical protein